MTMKGPKGQGPRGTVYGACGHEGPEGQIAEPPTGFDVKARAGSPGFPASPVLDGTGHVLYIGRPGIWRKRIIPTRGPFPGSIPDARKARSLDYTVTRRTVNRSSRLDGPPHKPGTT